MGVAGLGQIVGIRVLTEALSPEVFGEVNLMVGVAALATMNFFNPTMQALLRYYPIYMQSGDPSPAIHAAIRQLQKTLPVALPILLTSSVLAIAAGWVSLFKVLLLLALAGIDGARLFRFSIMNASRSHKLYGAWQIGEAWGRPIVAYLATACFGVRTEIVIGAFIVISMALYGVMVHYCPMVPNHIQQTQHSDPAIFFKFKAYSKPLIPLGILGWVYSMADRYMIAGMLSVEDAGMYIAVYGLASRPFLMLSTIVETAIRPSYYSAIGRNDSESSRKYLILWVLIVVPVGVAICALLAFLHQDVARLLLGQEFREASKYMPWIAGGYCLCTIYHILVRICYAHDSTKYVLFSETAGAIISAGVGFAFIHTYGLHGAAIAGPISFALLVVLSIYLAYKSSLRRAASVVGTGPAT